MLVSVSRRCDIPRFQFDWFMQRLDAGFVETVNPFNVRQVRRVSLLPARQGMKPEDGVDAFVFWTRNPLNILAHSSELTKRGFPFYVMTTITGYPPALEPNAVPARDAVNVMQELAREIGSERVIWRYDPILLSNITGYDFHIENFNALVREFSGTVKRVIVSLYTEYRGSKSRLERLEKAGGFRLAQFPDDSRVENLLGNLAESARAAGMEIQSCACEKDFSRCGIMPGACVDAALLKNMCAVELGGKDKNQRPNCLCCKSVDIGRYGMCRAGCVYCYAR